MLTIPRDLIGYILRWTDESSKGAFMRVIARNSYMYPALWSMQYPGAFQHAVLYCFYDCRDDIELLRLLVYRAQRHALYLFTRVNWTRVVINHASAPNCCKFIVRKLECVVHIDLRLINEIFETRGYHKLPVAYHNTDSRRYDAIRHKRRAKNEQLHSARMSACMVSELSWKLTLPKFRKDLLKARKRRRIPFSCSHP